MKIQLEMQKERLFPFFTKKKTPEKTVFRAELSPQCQDNPLDSPDATWAPSQLARLTTGMFSQAGWFLHPVQE